MDTIRNNTHNLLTSVTILTIFDRLLSQIYSNITPSTNLFQHHTTCTMPLVTWAWRFVMRAIMETGVLGVENNRIASYIYERTNFANTYMRNLSLQGNKVRCVVFTLVVMKKNVVLRHVMCFASFCHVSEKPCLLFLSSQQRNVHEVLDTPVNFYRLHSV